MERPGVRARKGEHGHDLAGVRVEELAPRSSLPAEQGLDLAILRVIARLQRAPMRQSQHSRLFSRVPRPRRMSSRLAGGDTSRTLSQSDLSQGPDDLPLMAELAEPIVLLCASGLDFSYEVPGWGP